MNSQMQDYSDHDLFKIEAMDLREQITLPDRGTFSLTRMQVESLD